MSIPACVQAPAEYDISFVAGDDFSFRLVFPFDLTDFVIFAQIGDRVFTITRLSNIEIRLSLTKTQTAGFQNHTQWRLTVSRDDITRTFIKGKFLNA
jgi:hypothetical protein